MGIFRRFWSGREGRKGNVAIIFALAIVPVIGGVGAAVDYAMANSNRTSMQKALDSTALALAKLMPLSQAQLDARGWEIFSANLGHMNVNMPQSGLVITTPTTGKILLAATGHYTPQISGLVGIQSFPVHAHSEVQWGIKKLELSLVLDVTGSMDQQGRMTELKKATKNLLTTLKNAAKQPDDVKIAIIPFAGQVNVDKTNVSASWLDWSNWIAEPSSVVTWKNNNFAWDRTGPGTSCIFTTGTHGFSCNNGLATPANDSTLSTIPTSGGNTGLICPSRDTGGDDSTLIGHYHSGCYTSVLKAQAQWYPVRTGSSASCGSLTSTQCQCTGSGSNRVCAINTDTTPTASWQAIAMGSSMSCGNLSTSNPEVCVCSGSGNNKVCRQKTYTHQWRPAPKTAWNGCVRDRNQSHDTQDTAPASVTSTTTLTNTNGTSENYSALTNPASSNAFQPVQNDYCPPALMPLTNDWTALNNKVDSLASLGATNITIGLIWGMHSVTAALPLTQTNTTDPQLTRAIILMTDGDNTLSRWAGNGSTPSLCTNCDARTTLACNSVKAANIRLYTVRMIDGNATLLRNCATNETMYFDVQNASQLNAVFNAIGGELASLHLSQ